MSTKTKKKLQSRRQYSDGFRRARVKDFKSGTFTVLPMSHLYEIGEGTLYSWIRKYSSVPSPQAMIVEVPNSQTEKVKRLEARIAELERALGRKQIELNYHAELLRVLEESGVAIQKKNFRYQAIAPTANVAAPRQALRVRKGQDLSQLIFHSDGGTQYRY